MTDSFNGLSAASDSQIRSIFTIPLLSGREIVFHYKFQAGTLLLFILINTVVFIDSILKKFQGAHNKLDSFGLASIQFVPPFPMP